MEFVDLDSDYDGIKFEIDNAVQSVINEKAFIGTDNNRFIKEFENRFNSYLGTINCISCGNGTDSLEIALLALGVNPGDEVIVPAISWISTAESVVNVGAKPIFVDVNDYDCNINVDLIEQAITNKTTCIIPVHLYGSPANMPVIMKLAKKYEIKVLEDCAQAHGASIDGSKVGTIGDAASFSFYPGKNLGAFGDAGCVIMKDNMLAQIAREIRNHGQKEKHNHLRIGRNSRMDGIQAAVITTKLKYLDTNNDLRIKRAKLYDEYIDSESVKPIFKDNIRSVFHLYVIKTDRREKLIENFKKHKIPFGIHYPTPLPSMKVFSESRRFEVAEDLCSKILSIPMHPYLTTDEIKRVSSIINSK